MKGPWIRIPEILLEHLELDPYLTLTSERALEIYLHKIKEKERKRNLLLSAPWPFKVSGIEQETCNNQNI